MVEVRIVDSVSVTQRTHWQISNIVLVVDGHRQNGCWLGLHDPMEEDDPDKLENDLKAVLQDAEGPVMLWVETCQTFLTIKAVEAIVKILIRNRELLQNKILASCIQTETFDAYTKMLHDVFFMMYTPQRPLRFVDTPDGAASFFHEIVSS